jgi:methyl-accepting chemotaxis protein
MTIKSKLTWNVVIVILIVATVAVTSVIGMGFIKSRLVYLTEQSTPYQVKTLELQRAIQGTTADLVKVSAAKNMEEYKTYRAEAEKYLLEVKNIQDSLGSLSGESKMETYNELSRTGKELFEITEGRIRAEEDAVTANKTITQKLKESSNKLKELDAKIKGLQLNRSAAFVTSLENTKDVLSKLRNIEFLKTTLKDLHLALFEIQKAQDKKAIAIAKSKVNSVVNKMLQNEYIKDSKNIHSDIKLLTEKIEELVKLQTSMLDQSNGEIKNRLDHVNKEVSERLSFVMLIIEQEVTAVSEKYGLETKRQGDVFTQANIATNVLAGNSELVSLGLSVEGLTTRLFTVNLLREVDIIDTELRKIFEKIDSTGKSLEKFLLKLDAKEEIKMFNDAQAVLALVKNLLFAKDGIIAKIRHQISMKEKAIQVTERLREIVLKQAEKGKKTVTAAKGEQEKAIATVNRMVRFSTILIVIIGLGSVIFGIFFGTWIYRSVSKPLNELIEGSEQISQGNLIFSKNEHSNDEIGTVQKSMSQMVSNLREIIGKIKTSTSTLANSSEELSATAISFEKGFTNQTSQIEQSATAMTQMSQTTIDVAKSSSHTSGFAQKMKNVALQGKELMHITSQELQKFADIVKESAQKIESLGRKSIEINEIVTMIKEIADQTNLLALNAAIEAARAGEQGRGFAVVADNVRQLAEKTTVATEDIAYTIKSMQTEVADSVNFMKEERESIEKILGHVKSTLNSIDEIVSYVEQVTDMVQRIAVATEEQSAASEEVSHNMENIAEITRSLSNSIVEIKRAAVELSNLASELNSITGWFKV